MPAISGLNLQRNPPLIEFWGSYEGPLPGQTYHVLRKSDIPNLNTIAEIENYYNNTWFPQELRDVNGQLMAYAAVHIYSISGSTIVWVSRFSTTPITGQWWPTTPPA